MLCFAFGQNLTIFKTTLLCFARRSRFLKMKKSNFALLCSRWIWIFKMGVGVENFDRNFGPLLQFSASFGSKFKFFLILVWFLISLFLIHSICSRDYRLPKYLLKCDFPILYFRKFFWEIFTLLCFSLLCFALKIEFENWTLLCFAFGKSKKGQKQSLLCFALKFEAKLQPWLKWSECLWRYSFDPKEHFHKVCS